MTHSDVYRHADINLQTIEIMHHKFGDKISQVLLFHNISCDVSGCIYIKNSECKINRNS
jgi:hypothetical protein